MSRFVTMPVRSIVDARGSLHVLDQDLPFDVKRVFWIFPNGTPVRGGHRHHKTRMLLIAMQGVVRIEMNDGKHHGFVPLDRSDQMLLVEPDDWHAMHFEEGSSLLVLASEHFDEHDYVYERYPTP
jgi:hypothetical protein